MTGDWLEQFEARLDSLARCARERDAALPQVLKLAHSALDILVDGPATAVDACLMRGQQLEVLATTQATRPDYGEDVLQRMQSLAVNADGSGAQSLPLLSPLPLADSETLVCVFHATSLQVAFGSAQDAVAALTEQISQIVSRQLLQQRAIEVRQQQQLTELAIAMAGCTNLRQAARVAATDGANLLSDCRISVVRCREGQTELLAVTGVNRMPESSETSAAIRQIAQESVGGSGSAAAPATGTPPAGGEWELLHEASLEAGSPRDTLAAAGVQRLVVTPADTKTTTAPGNGQPADSGLVFVCESFTVSADPALAVVAQFARTASAGLERFSGPDSFWRRSGARLRNIGLLLVGCLILLIPVDFEVEVEGRVQPTRYRRVFAPDNGTIDQVLFENEAHVVQDTVLMELSNPDNDQELGRVLGEIQTTLAELASATSRRLSGDDPTASADERRLATRLSGLESTRDLLQARVNGLRIVAPFDGTVFLRNAQEEMTTRPVRRGQMLLRVVADDTSWQLDLEIPDHLRGYLAASQADSDERLPVRYLIRAGSGAFHQTALQSLDATIRMVDARLMCRGVARATDLPVAHQRPGTAVVARISCGQKCLGFVWFREVLELWRYLRFAWF